MADNEEEESKNEESGESAASRDSGKLHAVEREFEHENDQDTSHDDHDPISWVNRRVANNNCHDEPTEEQQQQEDVPHTTVYRMSGPPLRIRKTCDKEHLGESQMSRSSLYANYPIDWRRHYNPYYQKYAPEKDDEPWNRMNLKWIYYPDEWHRRFDPHYEDYRPDEGDLPEDADHRFNQNVEWRRRFDDDYEFYAPDIGDIPNDPNHVWDQTKAKGEISDDCTFAYDDDEKRGKSESKTCNASTSDSDMDLPTYRPGYLLKKKRAFDKACEDDMRRKNEGNYNNDSYSESDMDRKRPAKKSKLERDDGDGDDRDNNDKRPSKKSKLERDDGDPDDRDECADVCENTQEKTKRKLSDGTDSDDTRNLSDHDGSDAYNQIKSIKEVDTGQPAKKARYETSIVAKLVSNPPSVAQLQAIPGQPGRFSPQMRRETREQFISRIQTQNPLAQANAPILHRQVVDLRSWPEGQQGSLYEVTYSGRIVRSSARLKNVTEIKKRKRD